MNGPARRRTHAPHDASPSVRAPTRKPITLKKLKRRHACIVFCFVTAALLIAGWFLFGCRVKRIVVEGGTIISEEAVLDAAKIKNGRHLYALDTDKIGNDVAAISPYIKRVTVTRALFGEVHIRIEEYDGAYYVEHENAYYILSDSLRVLDKTEDIADCLAKAEIRVILPEIKEAKVGKALVFADKTKSTTVRQTLESFSAFSYRDMLLWIDLSSEFAVTANADDRYRLILGNTSELDEKLTLTAESIRHLSQNMGGATGTLYAAIPGEVSFEVTGVAGG